MQIRSKHSCLHNLLLKMFTKFCLHNLCFHCYKLIGRATRASLLALGPSALACIRTLNYMLMTKINVKALSFCIYIFSSSICVMEKSL